MKLNNRELKVISQALGVFAAGLEWENPRRYTETVKLMLKTDKARVAKIFKKAKVTK